MLLSLLLLGSADAAPKKPIDFSVGFSGAAGTLGQSGSLAGRVRFGSGWQIGVRGDGALARGWYIDGWEVRRGTAIAGVLSTTIPLVRGGAVQVDIEVDGGLRSLSASDTDAPSDRATVVLADFAPMVTVPVRDFAAVRIGWKQITHFQVRPRSALEAQGSLLQGAFVVVPGDDIQLGVHGAVGGVFGFDGDGGKVLAQAGALVRWVPGSARTYTNH